MKNHLRGNLALFLSTVVICCVLYPAVIYALGRGLFPTGTVNVLELNIEMDRQFPLPPTS